MLPQSSHRILSQKVHAHDTLAFRVYLSEVATLVERRIDFEWAVAYLVLCAQQCTTRSRQPLRPQ